MRNYWLRIAVGAFAIFGIGMLIWSMVEQGKHEVERVVASADPITVPLAFIPFTVNGTSLGTLRRVRLERSAPDRVTAIKFRVKLADSVADDRLADCVLVTGGAIENVNAEHVFSCVPGADTAGKALEAIGEVATQRGTTYVLMGEAGTLESIHLEMAESMSDSMAQALEAQAESIAAEHEALGDSISRHVDSVMQETELRTKERMKDAMQKAKAAEARARAAAAAREAPAPPAPPAKP